MNIRIIMLLLIYNKFDTLREFYTYLPYILHLISIKGISVLFMLYYYILLLIMHSENIVLASFRFDSECPYKVVDW